MSEKLNLDALAACGDPELDARPEVQDVTSEMIRDWVLETKELTIPESATAFAEWLDEFWTARNEDADLTNGEVILGALYDWRGGRK
jgi:hypothetical protein